MELLIPNRTAKVKVTTTDGSELSAECMIDSQSAVNDILNDDNTTVNVYTLSGVLVKKNASRKELRGLAPGFYIVNGENVYLKN